MKKKKVTRNRQAQKENKESSRKPEGRKSVASSEKSSVQDPQHSATSSLTSILKRNMMANLINDHLTNDSTESSYFFNQSVRLTLAQPFHDSAHPVLRKNAITIKLRVVFDDNARSFTNIFINNCQLNGTGRANYRVDALKRSILFDLLGITQLIIIRGNILMQDLWQVKLQWDVSGKPILKDLYTKLPDACRFAKIF
ncbi:hypothetical protein ILUMI_08066 [Ignelater luminosus]|uniref:Uncharacterized protein n=1 Tax=Ignelater luminosus TaxID=2038154 RepID=A0A8K0GHE3_IGNLU|nr:hypothetical protein ILUMI_08066 [Ignelater luminosus]